MDDSVATPADSDPDGWASIPNWLLRDRAFSMADKMLYITLASRLGRHGVQAWPSQRLLAAEMGVSVDTVQRSVKRLKAAGVIAVQVIAHKTGRRNVYFIEVHPRDGRRSDCTPCDPEGDSK